MISVCSGYVYSCHKNILSKLCRRHCSTPKVGILGVQDDHNGSFLRGCSEAPDLIRKALHCESSNSYCELDFDINKILVKDYGNIHSHPNTNSLYEIIQVPLRDMINSNIIPITIGGDHSISYPICKNLNEIFNFKIPITILHFDAHPDLYENFENNPNSHASPFARISELVKNEKIDERFSSSNINIKSNEYVKKDVINCFNIMQFGIRGFNKHQREQASRFDISVFEMKDIHDKLLNHPSAFITSQIDTEVQKKYIQHSQASDIGAPISIPVYISFDMDALDPSCAPGVSHREPGGLTTREVLRIIHALPNHFNIIGVDIVEYNPSRDLNDGFTAYTAAKIMKELIGVIARNHMWMENNKIA